MVDVLRNLKMMVEIVAAEAVYGNYSQVAKYQILSLESVVNTTVVP